MTPEGFKVLVKPVLVKVTKYDTYNAFDACPEG